MFFLFKRQICLQFEEAEAHHKITEVPKAEQLTFRCLNAPSSKPLPNFIYIYFFFDSNFSLLKDALLGILILLSEVLPASKGV